MRQDHWDAPAMTNLGPHWLPEAVEQRKDESPKTIGHWPVGGIDCVQDDDIDLGELVLAAVRLVDEMDEQMWTLLQRNLAGVTEAEADWRPHPAANSVRWMLGHLAWFEEWAHDALRSEGRYLIDRDPTAYLEGTIPELTARFAAARARYRARLTQLDAADLERHVSYFARYDVSGMDLLKTHAMHLAGHRFQVRYVRGTYSRAHGTCKADFDPW